MILNLLWPLVPWFFGLVFILLVTTAVEKAQESD